MSAPERRAPCARPGPRGTIKGEYRERERERRDDTGGDPRAANIRQYCAAKSIPAVDFALKVLREKLEQEEKQ